MSKFTLGLMLALSSLLTARASALETAQPQTQVIVDDFGPRLLGGAADWHSGIDYSVSGDALSMEDAQVDEITWNGGLITLRARGISPGHIFRYLHMFHDRASLPIDDGLFQLRGTDQRNPATTPGVAGHLAIVKWTPGFVGQRADYILVRALDSADTVSGILDSTGAGPAPIFSSVVQGQAVGPAGTSGNVARHLHVDLSNNNNAQLSQNPLLHIVHLPSAFSVKFLDGQGVVRPSGFLVNPNDPSSTFIKTQVDSGLNSPQAGKDLDQVEIFVDEQSSLALVRKFSFGGLTAAHDPFNSDIEAGIDSSGEAIFFDGSQNGIAPRSLGGLEDFVYTNWETAGGPVAPRNLADGDHQLIVCTTNIRGQKNCDTRVSLNIADPYFLVENGKLTLSESASAKGRNPGFHGICYSKTHARSITAGGLLVGGQT